MLSVNINCVFFFGSYVMFQTKFYQIFGKFFEVRIFLNIMLSYKFKYPFFKRVLISMYALRVLGRCSGKSRPTQGHTTVPCVRPSGQGMIILLVSKLTIFNIFFMFLCESSRYWLLFL